MSELVRFYRSRTINKPRKNRSPQEIRDHPILEITRSLMHQDAEIEMIKTDPDATKEHRQLEKGRKGKFLVGLSLTDRNTSFLADFWHSQVPVC